MDLEREMAQLRALIEAEKNGRQIEREIWEAKERAEQEKSAEEKKWVSTAEAKRIVNRSSYNCLMQWVERGIIKPPKKLGRLYWDKTDLLKATPNGE